MKPEEEDERIADFLRASGTYAGLIRGIVTTCIFKFQKHLNTNQHEIKRFTELIRKIYNENKHLSNIEIGEYEYQEQKNISSGWDDEIADALSEIFEENDEESAIYQQIFFPT
ncbi:hypothetical protein RhiirA4_461003 [Rhizophagus irregularis]|uniref:Uncharacterized protein n=1 Tax=Rhizophagus irregularis TaxID=588596 RepID=A0A2I1GHV2_9GLOM|nr:hypothetical protein RhiirA4_461003 [Rhizophagus irregularis]